MTDVDADHFHLDRAGQRALLDLLAAIPALHIDLRVTIARQDRMGARGPMGRSRARKEQPLPFNLGAADVAQRLHNVLCNWAWEVCEQRGIDYEPPEELDRSMVPVARWLRRHVIDLALCEGADTALEQIRSVYDAAVKIIDQPAEKIREVDADQVAQARAWELNANGIATVARQLGPVFATLTRRRVHTLHEGRHIEPARWYDDVPVFRVGTVLDAHLAVPSRRKREKIAA